MLNSQASNIHQVNKPPAWYFLACEESNLPQGIRVHCRRVLRYNEALHIMSHTDPLQGPHPAEPSVIPKLWMWPAVTPYWPFPAEQAVSRSPEHFTHVAAVPEL